MRRLRRCAAVAVIVLIVGFWVSINVTPSVAAPVAAPACQTTGPDEASASAMAKRCGKRVEVLAKRSESSQTFANPDGSSTVTSSVVPARVHRSDGSWVAVDTTLRQRPDGSVAPVATVTDMVFSGGGLGPFATFRDKGSMLTVGLGMSLPKPTLVGSTAIYVDVFAGVDLRVTASAAGFRHVLVVKTAVAAANPALSDLRLAVGGDVVVGPAGEGRVRFADGKGRTVAVSDAAAMWDSTVNPGGFGEVKVSRAVLDGLKKSPPAELVSDDQRPGATARSATVGVRADADGHGVHLVPDAALLKDAVLPLFIDPMFGPGYSTWAYSRSVNSNYAVNGQAWIGVNPPCCGGDGSTFRSFFDFPTSGYKGKHVLSATFSIVLDHSYSCGPTVANLFRSTGAISVGSGGRMNWGDRPLGSGVPWIASASANANEAGGCGSIQPDFLMTFGGTETMRADVQAVANAQWDVYPIGLCTCDANGANEGAQDRWKRFTVDGNTTMSVTYNTVPSTPANLSPHQGQVACGGIVGTPSPVLTAQYADADGTDTLSAVFRWQELPSGSVNTVSGPSKPANNFGSVTLNLGAGSEGKSYQFQVQTNDGYDSSPWSPWCRFTVDTTAPPAPIVTPTASGTAPVYVACNPASINTCTVRGGPGVAGAFTFSEPTGTAGQDVVMYVYGWDSASTTVTVSAGAASPAILLTPPHYGLNKLMVSSVDGTGHSSPTTVFTMLVGDPNGAQAAAKAYWPLDSIDNHGFADQVSGSSLNANGVAWTNDARYIGAQAATFSWSTVGATQSVPSFDTSGSFSVAAWARLDTAPCGDGNGTVVSIDADPAAANNHVSAFYLDFHCSTQSWRFGVTDRNSTAPAVVEAATPNGGATTGQWTFLVGVFDENLNQAQLWVNGTLVQTATASSIWISNHGAGWKATGPVELGHDIWADAPHEYFRGQIADVRLWNRVVVADDIDGTDADPANGVPSQIGLMTPREVGSWEFPDGECFCASTPDGAAFSRPLTVSPNWTLDPNWSGDPATTPAWLTADSQNGSSGGVRLDGAAGYASTTDDRGTIGTADDVAHPVLRTDQSFTVSAWVRLDTIATYQAVLTQDNSVSSGFYLYYAPETGGRWKFKILASQASTDNTNASFADGPASNVTPTSWHHLVGVLDVPHRQIRLYVDGDLLVESPMDAAWQPWQANGSFAVGRASGPPFGLLLDGTVSDIHAWQGVLNAREVENLFALNHI
jgi:Concanavalin A-like lectin/glucanases superfamily